MPGPQAFEHVYIDEEVEAHLAGHQVSVVEVHQVLDNSPIWARNKKRRAAAFMAIGSTNGGRTLSVFFIWNEQTLTLTPATARDSTPAEVGKYLR